MCQRACSIVFRFLVWLSAFLVSFWLVSRNRPSIYLDDFQVSSLNKTQDSTTRIYFDLRIQNENRLVGIYYEDPLNLIFTYLPPTITTNTNLTVAKYTIQGFYQGNGKVKRVQDSVVVQDFLLDPRRKLGETNVPLIGSASVAVFRVDFDGNVKFKSIEKKKSHLVAGATLEVNRDTGCIVQKKIVQLEYSSGSNYWGFLQYLMFVTLYFLFTLSFWVAVYMFAAFLIILNQYLVASSRNQDLLV